MKMPPLNEQERAVLLHKATEAPFSGAYTDCFENGIYWRVLMMRFKVQ